MTHLRPSTYADVTIARDDAWLDANFDAVAARFAEWLSEQGVAHLVTPDP